MKIINKTKYPDETILSWHQLGREFIKTLAINPRFLDWGAIEIGIVLSGLKIHAPLKDTLILFPSTRENKEGIFVNSIEDEISLEEVG